MVHKKMRKHKKTVRKAKHTPKWLAEQAIKAGKKHGPTAIAFAKKHVTKENVRKAIKATREAESKLIGLLSRLKKNKQTKKHIRVTMSIFKR